MDRRTKRSHDRDEALQYLVEALADRSQVEAILLLSADGRIVAGTGMMKPIQMLAQVGLSALRGEESELFDAATRDTDFFGREIPSDEGSLYLVLLGTRISKMHEAVYGVTRILSEARSVTDAAIEQSVA